MEVLESGEQGVLQWDRKLSELSEPGDGEALMYHTVRTRRAGQEGFQSGEVRLSSPSPFYKMYSCRYFIGCTFQTPLSH